MTINSLVLEGTVDVVNGLNPRHPTLLEFFLRHRSASRGRGDIFRVITSTRFGALLWLDHDIVVFGQLRVVHGVTTIVATKITVAASAGPPPDDDLDVPGDELPHLSLPRVSETRHLSLPF